MTDAEKVKEVLIKADKHFPYTEKGTDYLEWMSICLLGSGVIDTLYESKIKELEARIKQLEKSWNDATTLNIKAIEIKALNEHLEAKIARMEGVVKAARHCSHDWTVEASNRLDNALQQLDEVNREEKP